MFLQNQTQAKQDNYIKLLTVVGGLSRLYSDNTTPYLYYRSHENIFCLTLDASNESRGDVSVDAVKGNVGIGLKTFLFKNSQYEKVAEFNKLLSTYRNLSGYDLAVTVAQARNERITITKRIYDLDRIIYHCIARDEGRFIVFEEDMDLVDIDSLVVDRETDAVIDFHDSKNNYKFNFGKSTLFKKFHPNETVEFDVKILEDPFTMLLESSESPEIIKSEFNKHKQIVTNNKEFVILPLYSQRKGIHVPEGSGLNQWNAEGRRRDIDEVYIPIPAWIHQVFDKFFPPQDENFKLRLPGGEIIDAKVCQAGGKALMSNPNKDLGKWLLRKVLNIKEGELVTYEMLVQVGIDSVIVTKNSDNDFEIDFKAVNTYEEFQREKLNLGDSFNEA